MSSSSIAAFPMPIGQKCVDFIRSRYPQWEVSLNAASFVPNVNAFVVESQTSTLLWVSFPQDADYELYSGIAAMLNSPWLHLIFQEHVVWEYNLYDEHHALVDRFEPLPQMWGHNQPRRGDADFLAKLWKIQPARIQNYFKPWSDRLRRRKAYLCRDQFRYGQFEQGYDFIEALTGLHLPK